MKNIIKFLTILALVVTGFTFFSCNNNDDNPDSVTDNTGSYKVYLNGNLYAEGTNVEAYLGHNYTNKLYLNYDHFDTEATVFVTGFPRLVGGVANMLEDLDPGVVVRLPQTSVITLSGIITRTSASKISFEGRCRDFQNPPQEYLITGFVASKAIEQCN